MINRLTEPQPAAAGSGLAIPFSQLLLAMWLFARMGEREKAQQAVNEARVPEQFRVDPVFPSSLRELNRFLEA